MRGRFAEEARRDGGIGVLHDLAPRGKRANIDHVVVGRAGVTVIDAKAWTGDLWVGDNVIGRGRRGRHKPIEETLSQVQRVREALAASGREDVRVEGAICFVNENPGIPRDTCERIDDIAIGTPGPVSRHAMRGGCHDVADVAAIARILERAFVVSGGKLLPTTPSSVSMRQRSLHGSGRARRRPPAIAILVRALLALTFAMAALSLAVDLLGTAAHTATTLSQREVLAHRAEYRQLAKTRAHGTVRGPRIITGAASDEFVYRRGRRCRIRLIVDRSRLANPLATATVSSTGCRRT